MRQTNSFFAGLAASNLSKLDASTVLSRNPEVHVANEAVGKRSKSNLNLNTVNPYQLSVSPQPSPGRVNLSISNLQQDAAYATTIIDVSGRLVFDQVVTYSTTKATLLDLSTLSSGTYCISVETSDWLLECCYEGSNGHKIGLFYDES